MQLKYMYGTGIVASSLNDGDELPVGGSFLGRLDRSLKIDSDQLTEFLAATVTKQRSIPLEKLGSWLKSANADISPELFSHMYSFNKVLHENFALAETLEKQEKRSEQYADSMPCLSNIAASGNMMCAEIATLAQLYFQHVEIASQYIGGEVLPPDREFSSPHSYNMLHEGEKHYLFDPTIPVKTTGNDMPRFYGISDDLYKYWYHSASESKAFMRLKNPISQNFAVYGIGSSGSSVREDSIFSEDNIVHDVQHTR